VLERAIIYVLFLYKVLVDVAGKRVLFQMGLEQILQTGLLWNELGMNTFLLP